MNPKEKQPAPPAPAIPRGIQAVFAYIRGVLSGLANAHGLVEILTALWPAMLFATLSGIIWMLCKSGAFWALPAFVLPLAVILLMAGPKPPPPR